jgi:hypothetical protein
MLDEYLGQSKVKVSGEDGGSEHALGAEGRNAPDDGVADQVVLDVLGCPAAHAEAEVEEWPGKWRGGEDVLLVGVGHERIVGRHHGNVEVPEIAEEGRLVELGVALGDWQRGRRRGRSDALSMASV